MIVMLMVVVVMMCYDDGLWMDHDVDMNDEFLFKYRGVMVVMMMKDVDDDEAWIIKLFNFFQKNCGSCWAFSTVRSLIIVIFSLLNDILLKDASRH